MLCPQVFAPEKYKNVIYVRFEIIFSWLKIQKMCTQYGQLINLSSLINVQY